MVLSNGFNHNVLRKDFLPSPKWKMAFYFPKISFEMAFREKKSGSRRMTTNDGSQGKRVDLAKGHGVADGI